MISNIDIYDKSKYNKVVPLPADHLNSPYPKIYKQFEKQNIQLNQAETDSWSHVRK